MLGVFITNHDGCLSESAITLAQCASSQLKTNHDFLGASIVSHSSNHCSNRRRCERLDLHLSFSLTLNKGIIIDCEHGHISDDSMHSSTAAIAAMGVSPLVRLRMTHLDLVINVNYVLKGSI